MNFPEKKKKKKKKNFPEQTVEQQSTNKPEQQTPFDFFRLRLLPRHFDPEPPPTSSRWPEARVPVEAGGLGGQREMGDFGRGGGGGAVCCFFKLDGFFKMVLSSEFFFPPGGF